VDALGWTIAICALAFCVVFVLGVLVGVSCLSDDEKGRR